MAGETRSGLGRKVQYHKMPPAMASGVIHIADLQDPVAPVARNESSPIAGLHSLMREASRADNSLAELKAVLHVKLPLGP